MFKQNKGFTLVQLIVTVAIISVLAGAVLFGEDAISRKGKAQDIKRQQDVENIAKAIELYQIDNGALPGDLSTANINTGHKVVLCSSASTLSCDGQSRACLVIDDDDFIKPYFGNSLPVDPQKTNTSDTGYYITRSGNKMVFGACTNYGDSAIEHVALASLATYITTCGDGEVEGTEVCDDGDTFSEECGNGAIETAGTYCNYNCTAVLTVYSDEWCDSSASDPYCFMEGEYYYSTDVVYNLTYCNKFTIGCNDSCDDCIGSCTL